MYTRASGRPFFEPKRLRCAEHVQRFSAGLLDVLEGFAMTLRLTAGGGGRGDCSRIGGDPNGSGT